MFGRAFPTPTNSAPKKESVQMKISFSPSKGAQIGPETDAPAQLPRAKTVAISSSQPVKPTAGMGSLANALTTGDGFDDSLQQSEFSNRRDVLARAATFQTGMPLQDCDYDDDEFEADLLEIDPATLTGVSISSARSATMSSPLPGRESRPPFVLPSYAQHNSTETGRNLEDAITLDDDASAFEPVSLPPLKRRRLPWAVQTDAPAPQKQTKKSAYSSGDAVQQYLTSSATGQVAATRKLQPNHSFGSESNQREPGPATRAAIEPHAAPKEEINLSEEQQYIVNLVVKRKGSVFFTGSAGTGKSVLLRALIEQLKEKYAKEGAVAVTASTGLAACNVSGTTLHRFSGVGLGKGPIDLILKRVRGNRRSVERWKSTAVLIVDEISMVDGDFFDMLEQVAREIRKNDRPFGGIQLVVTGDFFQLPPVPDRFEGSNRKPKFAFDAASWNTSITHTICLHQVFRQKDPVFAEMLNQMREGQLTLDSIQRFSLLNRPLQIPSGIQPTELFATRNEVDNSNYARMRNLTGDKVVYVAKDGGQNQTPEQIKQLLSSFLAPEKLELKKGAQVMLIKNLSETLVNGLVGTVRAFMSMGQFKQGLMSGFPPEYADIQTDDLARLISNQQYASESDERFPVVRFELADKTFYDVFCAREDWSVEMPAKVVLAYRSQVPLMLAWALSIHKAQGQTLEYVRVNMNKVFEKGQAYVALSRATTMSGLQIVGFESSRVMVDERVREFYLGLKRAGKLRRPKAPQPGTEAGTANASEKRKRV